MTPRQEKYLPSSKDLNICLAENLVLKILPKRESEQFEKSFQCNEHSLTLGEP